MQIYLCIPHCNAKLLTLQCWNIIYLNISLLKDVRLGCTSSRLAKALIQLCFYLLDVNQSLGNKVCYSAGYRQVS